MKVVISPGAERSARGFQVAETLAGPEGGVVMLSQRGVKNLRRRLSQVEVHAIRELLGGAVDLVGSSSARPGPADGWSPAPGAEAEAAAADAATAAAGAELLIGYVCAGTAVPGVCPVGVTSVVVTDHVNLTWWSPLTGPNDDRLGPRFPVVAGMYRPRGAAAAAGNASVDGVVAGVRDDSRLTVFEKQVVERHGMTAVSSELVAVGILAAHMGLKVAAVVVL